jgi:hypothetical protein
VHSPLISVPSLLDDGAADLLVSGHSDQSSVAHRSGRRSGQAGAAPRWAREKGCDEEWKSKHLGYCQCGERIKARVFTCCAHNIWPSRISGGWLAVLRLSALHACKRNGSTRARLDSPHHAPVNAPAAYRPHSASLPAAFWLIYAKHCSEGERELVWERKREGGE